MFSFFSTRRTSTATTTRTDAAIDRARTLLTRGSSWRAQTIENRIITNDAPKVNDRADVTGRRGQQARSQLLDNAPLERDALMRLSPADQASYQTVKDALLEPAPGRRNGDPVAALALQTTLLEGGLPGERALGSSDTLLGGLEHLATQEEAPGIDRQQLLSDVVQEVATPQAVAQSTAVGAEGTLGESREFGGLHKTQLPLDVTLGVSRGLLP